MGIVTIQDDVMIHCINKQQALAHFLMNRREMYLMQGGQLQTWNL